MAAKPKLPPTPNVLYTDFPWEYRNVKTGGSHVSGAAQKYDVMSYGDGLKMGELIKPWMRRDAVLFKWATAPMLPEAIDMGEQWGFDYKGIAAAWVKPGRLGMGFWFRNNVELCLLFVRGDVRPFRQAVPNYLIEHASIHSAKPELMRARIEQATRAMPSRRMVELFGRRKAYGWDVYGRKLDGRDVRTTIQQQIEARS